MKTGINMEKKFMKGFAPIKTIDLENSLLTLHLRKIRG